MYIHLKTHWLQKGFVLATFFLNLRVLNLASLEIYYKSVLLLFLIVQGLVFTTLLFVQVGLHGYRPARWLAVFLLLCCLYLTPWMLGHENWYAWDGYREVLFFIPFHQLFLLGPVVYFYVRSLLEPDFRFGRKDYFHLLPAVLYLLYSGLVFVVDVLVLDEFYFYADGRDKDFSPWYQITGALSMLFYVGLAYRAYRAYRRRIYAELSYADEVVFAWLRQFLIALLFILTVRSLFLIFLPEWGNFGTKWWYYLAFGISAYFIGVAGYTNTIKTVNSRHLSRRKDGDFKVAEPGKTAAKPEHAQAMHSEQSPVTGILPEELIDWKERLVTLIEDNKLYQNPTLTLQDVADRLGTHSRQVSAIVNQGFNVNFNDFVNQYRVQAVQDRLLKREHETHTLLSIALDCGFNSKTTFNRVFKKSTGQSPLHYLKKMDDK